jgi:ABC-type uncharacterized transport system permease subunit
MENLLINVIEISLLLSLLYGVLKYWIWNFLKKNIPTNNKIFGLFLFFQIVTMLVMINTVNDQQNQSYLEQMEIFGDKSISIWSVFGVQIFGLAFLYMLSNILSFLLIKITFPIKTEVYEEIKSENYSLILTLCALVISIGFITSSYILKPILLNWLSQSVGLIPLK